MSDQIDCPEALEALEALETLDKDSDRALIGAGLQEHLAQCNQCSAVSSFSKRVEDAARALPFAAAPPEMEANIMTAVLAEMQENSGATSRLEGAKTNELGSRLSLFCASCAFAIIMFSIDPEIWNLLSWALSLALIVLLKPLIESPSAIAGKVSIEAMN